MDDDIDEAELLAAAKDEWRKAKKDAHEKALKKRQKQSKAVAHVPVAPKRVPWSVEAVMEDADGLKVFTSYCEESLSDENLKFILDAQEWRKQWASRSDNERDSTAKAIVAKYLANGAEYWVSLPSSIPISSFAHTAQGMFEAAILESFVTARALSEACRVKRKSSRGSGWDTDFTEFEGAPLSDEQAVDLAAKA